MSNVGEVEETEVGNVAVGLENSDGTSEVYLYSVVLNVQTREFKGQTSGVTKSKLQFHCNAVSDFKSDLWAKVKEKFKREVVFDENEPRWHESMLPEEGDMERFVLFYDAKSKRSMTMDKITMLTIGHWRTKEIWLYIHVYSMSIANLSLWKKVQKTLIEPINRDRAGASNIAETNALVERLKKNHILNYQSNHINWIMWTNRIQASEPHLHEQLINKPPPPDMLHLFAVARTSADTAISNAKQNLCVAVDVNEGVSSGLSRVRTLMDEVSKIRGAISDLQKEEQVKLDLLSYEMQCMELQAVTTRSLITSMERALPATETDFGRQLFSQIQDQEDVDHMVLEN